LSSDMMVAASTISAQHEPSDFLGNASSGNGPTRCDDVLDS
jgi:hypothetical protein